ncbi:UDP-galactopyranose mutase [Empedobacter brevis]|uniref:UDP-galactopyranose mutase n=1 Tax=Empedobacter brevis TaxID=247 RepID=A0AAJ1QG11_9FLAO|nr:MULTISPECIES: UDP-galactopyranose mutase [Empedobacter]MDM1073364.1 UDP-galactopyranose mutase [Empedobacter brevis]QHC83773.1 UDP-galactopyranose mutase [Empedobacter brevis]
MKKILIVGAGFSGAVVAERLSQQANYKILILESRDHIGGNCYTERDSETNIMEHKYGPHIFNTDNKHVWDYIQNFCEMKPFVNRVKSIYNGNVYSLPINLHTINQYYNKTLSPVEAKLFIEKIADRSIENPSNFEEQALKFIGKDLYKAFFYGYTKKQWGCEPKDLPASILKRLPVRFNYDDNYYTNPYQGIPKDGYTSIFEKMLTHPSIEIKTNTNFNTTDDYSDFDTIIYTGPIDAYFNFKHGRLSYRTVEFEKHITTGDYQGNAVINYADPEVPFTRIHEHKHFTPWESHEKTIYFKEYSKETGVNDIPYYPKRLSDDLQKLELYQAEIEELKNIHFIGRLATYRYMDMHQVIKEALDLSELLIKNG